MAEFGRVDILVNNAGIGTAVPATRETVEEFERVIDVNLNGCYWMAQACGRVMKPGSSIINISSVLGLTTAALPQAAYSASKAGLIGLTKSLARELASRNIRVNAVSPGFIDTDMTAGLNAELRDAMTEAIPLGRLGTADEVARAVLFLAGDAASYVTGEVLKVNGGMYM